MTRNGQTVLLVLLCGTLSACSNELSRNQAERLLHDHVETISGDFLSDSVEQRIKVDRILMPDETLRRVEFRVLYESNSQADTTDIYSAVFQRSDEGWSLTGYGSELRKAVSLALAQQREHTYRAYLSTLDTIYWASSNWYRSQIGEPDQIDSEHLELLQKGPSSEQVARLISRHDIPIPDSLEWGVYDSERSGEGRVLWVRSRSDTTVQCMEMLSIGSEVPAKFIGSGLEESVEAVCEGRNEGRFRGVFESMDEIERRLLESGTIYRPR